MKSHLITTLIIIAVIIFGCFYPFELLIGACVAAGCVLLWAFYDIVRQEVVCRAMKFFENRKQKKINKELDELVDKIVNQKDK